MTPGWPPFSYDEDSGVWEEAVLSQATPGRPLVFEVLVILWSWFLIVKGIVLVAQNGEIRGWGQDKNRLSSY